MSEPPPRSIADQPEKLYRLVHYRMEGSKRVAASGKPLEYAEGIRDMPSRAGILGKVLIEAE